MLECGLASYPSDGESAMTGTTGQTLLKWWPVLLVAAGLVASGVTAQNQIKNITKEMDKLTEDVEENEDDISEMRRKQLRDTAEIKGDVKLILRLLEDREDN